MVQAIRFHDISCGHRVFGHEGKCRFLHGHNYRIHFHLSADSLDEVGRVLDFGVIKSKLCQWLEEEYDHKFLIWSEDPDRYKLGRNFADSLVIVPFNPTAENIARHLVEVVGPLQLVGTGAKLIKVIIEETRKCSASFEIQTS